MDFDMNIIREATTILAFVTFIVVAWWAYNPRRKKQLDEIGRSVLDD